MHKVALLIGIVGFGLVGFGAAGRAVAIGLGEPVSGAPAPGGPADPADPAARVLELERQLAAAQRQAAAGEKTVAALRDKNRAEIEATVQVKQQLRQTEAELDVARREAADATLKASTFERDLAAAVRRGRSEVSADLAAVKADAHAAAAKVERLERELHDSCLKNEVSERLVKEWLKSDPKQILTAQAVVDAEAATTAARRRIHDLEQQLADRNGPDEAAVQARIAAAVQKADADRRAVEAELAAVKEKAAGKGILRRQYEVDFPDR